MEATPKLPKEEGYDRGSIRARLEPSEKTEEPGKEWPSMKGNISDTPEIVLDSEPNVEVKLSQEQMEMLHNLGSAGLEAAGLEFKSQLDSLTPTQIGEFMSYVVERGDDASTKKLVHKMSSEQQDAYLDAYNADKQVKELQMKAIAEAKNSLPDATGTEEEFLRLHSLKFYKPEQFKEVFNDLPFSVQNKFIAFEAAEDNKVRTANPSLTVPRLSVDGETWLKTEAPSVSTSGQRTAEEMQKDASEARAAEKAYLKSISVDRKPTIFSRFKRLLRRAK